MPTKNERNEIKECFSGDSYSIMCQNNSSGECDIDETLLDVTHLDNCHGDEYLSDDGETEGKGGKVEVVSFLRKHRASEKGRKNKRKLTGTGR